MRISAVYFFYHYYSVVHCCCLAAHQFSVKSFSVFFSLQEVNCKAKPHCQWSVRSPINSFISHCSVVTALLHFVDMNTETFWIKCSLLSPHSELFYFFFPVMHLVLSTLIVAKFLGSVQKRANNIISILNILVHEHVWNSNIHHNKKRFNFPGSSLSFREGEMITLLLCLKLAKSIYKRSATMTTKSFYITQVEVGSIKGYHTIISCTEW